MKYEKLLDIIEEIAPPELTEDWDNTGVQIYTGKEEIQTVLVALEMNRDVIADAIVSGADMIITHHPLIFGGLNKIDVSDRQTGVYIKSLLEADISVYSAHLSFDNAARGNNFYLADLMELENVERPPRLAENVPFVVGTLKETQSFKDSIRMVKNALWLESSQMRCVGDPDSMVKKVGICTGGGGEFIDEAIRYECDLFISGDVKFHEAQKAKAVGVNLIDAGHYGTEKIFAENFAAQLKEKAGDELIIRETMAVIDPFIPEDDD